MDAPLKILAVDDAESMRKLMGHVLKGCGEVRTAADGEEALAAYLSFAPDIVLLDLNMPRMGGLDVIERIRAHDADTFIIVLTAEEGRQVKAKALGLGANDFLAKPPERVELLARLGVAERQVRLMRRLRETNTRLSHEMEAVAGLQERLLPTRTPYIPGVKVQGLYRPSGQASGDYYDYVPLGDDVLRVCIADVSGHGARAAFLMSAVRTLFRTTAEQRLSLEATLGLVNRHLGEMVGQEPDFVTLFAADIAFSDKWMEYINAGHCPGMAVSVDTTLSRLDPHMPLLGCFELDFTGRARRIEAPRELLLFTDGFYEWRLPDGGGDVFGLEPFWDLATGALNRERPHPEDEGRDGHPSGDEGPLAGLMRALEEAGAQAEAFRDDLTALWIKADG